MALSTPPAVDTLNHAAHVVQLALTPIFLLSAVAALLNVFSARLARVADQVERVTGELGALDGVSDPQRHACGLQLRRLSRAHTLDVAVVLGSFAGVATSASTLALFLGAFSDRAETWSLYASFGAALLCTVGALGAYMVEMLMASRSVRREADAHTGAGR